MPDTTDHALLDALLDSWDRNNTILVNLLRAIPVAQRLNESVVTVRNAVRGRLMSGRAMDLHYDHPILMLQHMIWHEGYHHGQIKLALKIAGRSLSDDDASPITWGIWMRKTGAAT